MNIRPMVAADIPALAAWMAGDPLWQRYGVTEASATRRLAQGLAEGATIAVADPSTHPQGVFGSGGPSAPGSSLSFAALPTPLRCAQGRLFGRGLRRASPFTAFRACPECNEGTSSEPVEGAGSSVGDFAGQDVEGQPAGFVWYVERGAFARSGYIMLIGVRPELRGQGIGAALMAHAEAAMFSHVADVFLLVSDFNVAARRFYERLGYVRVGALADYVVPGVTELIYRKRRCL